MTKSQLIHALYEKSKVPLRESEVIVNTIFRSMSDSLLKGEGIEIRGFFSFTLRNYKPYMGRNPKTKEVVEVKEKKLPYFRVGKGFKARLNQKKR
jgi:integration host factor subunit beta